MKPVFRLLFQQPFPCLLILIGAVGNVCADLFLPRLMADIVNSGVLQGNIPLIYEVGLRMLCISAAGGLCAIVSSFFSARVSARVARELRGQLFAQVEQFSLQEIDQLGTASLITRTTNDVIQIQTFLNMFLRIVIMAPIMAAGGILMALDIDRQLSNIIFLTIPVLVLLIVVVSRFVMPLSSSMQEKLDRVNLIMREKLTGIRVMRAFGTEAYEQQRFDGANRDLTRTTLKMQRIMMGLMPALMLVLNLSIITLVGTGARFVQEARIETGDIMAIIQYVMQILMSLMMISMTFIILPRAQASASRISQVLDTPISIHTPDQPQKTGSTGEVHFEHVTFSYPGSPDPILRDVTFTAPAGKTTAIIGATGCGKSTLLNLIPRFYDVTQGQILVGGVDVRQQDLALLREKIGYVPQKALLFSGSIADNIRFGNEEASEGEIRTAARIAQALDFVEEKPQGFHSPIARGGGNVSGGQRQRLAIARAVVKRPALYLFDDSFSALDFKTDARLRQALARETHGATTLIVAQRVSTIMHADLILVMQEGSIVGSGTHEQLMQTCEVYREIAVSQHIPTDGKEEA
ncbi:MAG: ABC transporter ATP-binding protein [Eubacteriales bacterium]|jgi:ATP-binding cassette subfamily B multidrug efflux pump